MSLSVEALDSFFVALSYMALCNVLAIGSIPIYVPFRKHPIKTRMRRAVTWQLGLIMAAVPVVLVLLALLPIPDPRNPELVILGMLVALPTVMGLAARWRVARTIDLPEPGLAALRRLSPPIGTLLDRRRMLPFDIVSLGGTAGVAAALFLTEFDVVRGMASLVEPF